MGEHKLNTKGTLTAIRGEFPHWGSSTVPRGNQEKAVLIEVEKSTVVRESRKKNLHPF